MLAIINTVFHYSNIPASYNLMIPIHVFKSELKL